MTYIPVAEYVIGCCDPLSRKPYKTAVVKADSLSEAMQKGTKELNPGDWESIVHVETRPNPDHVVTLFDTAQKEFLEAKKAVKLASNKLDAARAARNKLCPHTNMVPKEIYSSGSYYDKAYTETWTECACCGMTTQSHIQEHSWYG